jgi:ribosome-associated translation inhibitor RaiA
MEFLLNAKNFEVSDEMLHKLNHVVRKLKRPMMTLAHFEKAGDVVIEKFPAGEFRAKIHFHLPKHSIAVEKSGFSVEQAVNRAALDVREKILKIKELHKSTHAKHRRTEPVEPVMLQFPLLGM